MDPETRKALDRAYRRELRSLWIWPLALFVAFGGIAAFWLMPREAVGVIEARFERFVTVPSDDNDGLRLILELADGRTVRLPALPGEARLEPGATLCLAQSRHPILGAIRYTRVPNARCTEEGATDDG